MLFNGCVICNNYYQSVLTLNATHFIGGSIPEIIVDNNYTYFEFYIQSPISLQGTISIGCNKTNAIKLRSICCNRIASIAEDTFPDITSENTWKPYTPLI